MMRKFIKSLAWSRVQKTAVSAVLAAAFAMSARAEVSGEAVVPGGGSIAFSGASSTNWVYNAEMDSYDLVLVYTNSAAEGASFTLPG
ncbi:MAG: hypothetical protein IKE55_04325, partial [Kiritimatiellae bacterium]|nr:hypothetical protein [Kiritimatiellia bacterium]